MSEARGHPYPTTTAFYRCSCCGTTIGKTFKPDEPIPYIIKRFCVKSQTLAELRRRG